MSAAVPSTLDPAQKDFVGPRRIVSHEKAGEPGQENEIPEPKASRLEEALKIIEEYAKDLREIIKKLRQHLQ